MNSVQKHPDFFESLPQPVLGILLIIMGIIILLGAIYDWDWLFQKGGSSGVWNLQWMDGFFGHKFARRLMGVIGGVIILSGIFALVGILNKID